MASSLLPHPLHPASGRVKDGAGIDLSPARWFEMSYTHTLHGFVFQKTIMIDLSPIILMLTFSVQSEATA